MAAWGASSGSSLLCAIYHVIAVVGCLGCCVGGCLLTSCAVGCPSPSVGVLVPPEVCSLIFCCLCAMMPRSLVWARVHNLSRSALAVRVSWRRAVLLIPGVLCPFCFLVAAMEGRTWASAVAMSVAVSLRVVPAWPMGMQTRLTLPQ